MRYPERIIPHANYKEKIFDGEVLIEINPGILVGRRIEENPEECLIYDQSEIPVEIVYQSLSKSMIYNLSMSVLGGSFLIEDFSYNQKEDGAKDWKDKKVIELKDFKEGTDYYRIESPLTIVCWNIDFIHHISLSGKRNFSKFSSYTKWIEEIRKRSKSEVEIKSYIDAYNKLKEELIAKKHLNNPAEDPKINSSVELDAYLRIRHNPTNLNYWHVTMDIFPEDYFGSIPPKEDKEDKFLIRLFKLASERLRKSFTLCDESLSIPPLGDMHIEAL